MKVNEQQLHTVSKQYEWQAEKSWDENYFERYTGQNTIIINYTIHSYSHFLVNVLFSTENAWCPYVSV
jgi:hypothetical protein